MGRKRNLAKKQRQEASSNGEASKAEDQKPVKEDSPALSSATESSSLQQKTQEAVPTDKLSTASEYSNGIRETEKTDIAGHHLQNQLSQKTGSAKQVQGNKSSQSAPETSALAIHTKRPQNGDTSNKECTSLILPRRPDKGGTQGRPIDVITNFFSFTLPTGIIYHYDVEITPFGKDKRGPEKFKFDRRYRNQVRKVNWEIIQKLVKPKGGIFNGAKPSYDGYKNLYLKQRIPDDRLSVSVDHEIDGLPVSMEVQLKLVRSISMDCINQLYKGGNREDALAALQAINTIIKHGPTLTYTPVGRSFFKKPDHSQMPPFGGGKEIWFGFTPSAHYCAWKPMLNLNITATTFYKAGPFLDFISDVLNDRTHLRSGTLNERQIRKVLKQIKGVKLETRHLGDKRTYRVTDATNKPASQVYFNQDGKRISVSEYFRITYKPLMYPNMPCIVYGNAKNPKYIPFELLIVPENYHCKRKLDGKEAANMIKVAAVKPEQRFNQIEQNIRTINCHHNGVHNEFGIRIDPQPVGVTSRILNSFTIKYKNNSSVRPKDGSWNLRNQQLLVPVIVKKWAVIVHSDCLSELISNNRFNLNRFLEQFEQNGRGLGISINKPHRIINTLNYEKVFEYLKEMKDCDFVLIMINSKEEDPAVVRKYQEIKLFCENFEGIFLRTQFVKYNTVLKVKPEPQSQVLVNLWLKLNAKLGGVNHCGLDKPDVLKQPVLILGADVNHSGPGQCYPSIAAVVGSLDGYPAKYHAAVRVQKKLIDKNEREIIRDLKCMVKEILRSFYRNTKAKPGNIIFYRDGVGEGQFAEVLHYELQAIRDACKELEEGYTPGITFIIVQKRHNARFKPKDSKDGVGNAGNIPPGTIIDTKVVHPIDFDFYLCSHLGLQGTSRPSHYYVLHDDLNFSSDKLQELTYYLCHTYVRCSKSVSIPAPVYYSHWVAYRASQHGRIAVLKDMNVDLDSCSESSEIFQNQYADVFEKAVRVKNELETTMYFV